MAKKVVATLKQVDGKVLAKCIKMVKNPKTGSYQFKEEILDPDMAKDFFNKK
jgi:hypothetical protein